MHIHVQSADRLGKALASANAAINTKGDSTPITGAMLLQTGTDELSITVANTTTHQLRLSVPCQVVIPGAVLVPGDYFTKVMNRLGDREVTLQVQENQLIASAGLDTTHKFDLFQGEPEDFPVDHDLPPIAATVDADGLHEALKAVLTSVTEQEQDIIFEGKGKTIGVMTSLWITTRSRFQLTKSVFDFAFGVPKSIITGGRLPQWSGTMQIHVGDGKVAFSQGNEHLIVRAVKQNPDVETIDSIISTDPVGRFVVSLALIKNRIHTIAIGKNNCVLKVTGKTQKNLLIQAENAGSGASKMQIPVQGQVTGTVKEIKLDVSLLEKALKTIDGDDLRIDIVDYLGDGSSISLRIANEANPEKRQTMILSLQ